MAGWTVPGYTEIRVLGTGEAGRIVEAVHDATGVRAAITYPAPALRANEAFRERLRADAELLAGLEHPNVVRVRALAETGSEAALITEAVEGAALRRVLESAGPLPPEASLAVLRASLLGLGAADEAGVAHRDYQPSTVVVTPEGVVKVGGFGLAARTAAMMPAAGTSSYMAPELWEGAAAGLVTDLYAATATFYECLTGHVPYSADSVFELQTRHRAAPIPVADVPAALKPLVVQGLAKDPEDRPATVASFLAELDVAAVVEFGLEWEDRGRRELAALVAALPEEESAAEAATSVLAGVAATSVLAGVAATSVLAGVAPLSGEEAAGAGMGRGTKIGMATAAVVVIGAVVAAMAFSSGKHTAAARSSGSGDVVSVASDQGSSSDAGAAPGVAGAAVPSPGSSGTGHSSPTKATTGGPATSTSATGATTPGTTTAPIGLPAPSLSTTPSLPDYPPPSPTSGPTTPAGSTGPTTTPSVALSISASATMTNTRYSGPCPPTTDPPAGTVTFSVSGLPAGGSVTISYHWRVVGDSASGDSAKVVVSHNGSTTQSFTISTDQHSQKGLSGTVEVSWTAPGTPGGSTDAGPVDIICSPGSGGTSGAGPTSG